MDVELSTFNVYLRCHLQNRDVRRRLLIIAIFLLAGAVVNVALAWACAVNINPFAGMAEVRRMTQLEDEVLRLKQLVAELSLDKAMLQDASGKRL